MDAKFSPRNDGTIAAMITMQSRPRAWMYIRMGIERKRGFETTKLFGVGNMTFGFADQKIAWNQDGSQIAYVDDEGGKSVSVRTP